MTVLWGSPEPDCQVWCTYCVIAFAGSRLACAGPALRHSNTASGSQYIRGADARLKAFNNDKMLPFPLRRPSDKWREIVSRKDYGQQLMAPYAVLGVSGDSETLWRTRRLFQPAVQVFLHEFVIPQMGILGPNAINFLELPRRKVLFFVQAPSPFEQMCAAQNLLDARNTPGKPILN